MSCNQCGKKTCYTNPCGGCGHNNDCDCNLYLDWVPHSKGTISLVDGKCSDTLDLCPGVKACETVTHLDFNDQTGCIVFENEKYLSTDGAEGTLETVCVSEFYPFIKIENLADVDYDDELKGDCYEFIYKKDVSCGDGCRSKGDRWVNWNVHSPGAKVQSMDYIRGATEDGCPVYLDKPDNCSFMMFSPSCTAPTGEWQAKKIEHQDADLALDSNGRYNVLTLDDCGCPVERQMPVIPTGMTAINYQRDSVPDDPDFPWYYGNYNDKINLHLRENAKDYFGKYALKVTVNYGIQAIKSDRFKENYNFRSLVVPVVDGEQINTEMEASILQGFCGVGVFPDGTYIWHSLPVPRASEVACTTGPHPVFVMEVGLLTFRDDEGERATEAGGAPSVLIKERIIMDKCNDFPVKHIDSRELPLWREDTIPESATLLMMVTEQDKNCGQYLPFAYKLPASFLTPGSSTSHNVTTINGNGANIVIPDHQVRAGYVFNNSPNDIRLADKDDGTKPMFLIVARNTQNPEQYDIVTDGIYKFNTKHEYVIGYTYYLGLLGQPTTENTGTPLFDVIDSNKIRVHL